MPVPTPAHSQRLLEFALLVVGLVILIMLAVSGLETLQAELARPGG